MSNDRIVYRPDPETWLDRFVAGVISSFLMFFIALIGPFLFGLDDFAEGVYVDLYGPGFKVWITALTMSTLVTGFMAGPRKMARFWGYFFATEEPARPNLTGAIWIGIAAVIVISCKIA